MAAPLGEGRGPHRQLLIKLREGERLRQADQEGEVVLWYGQENLTEIFRQAGLLTPSRDLRQSFPRLVEKLRGSPQPGGATVGPNLYSSRSLDLFVRLTFTDPDDATAEAIVGSRALSRWVESVAPVLPRADRSPEVPDHEPRQGYLNRGASPLGPAGIDARYAWGIGRYGGTNGRGQGITVCDVETGVFLEHDNLPEVTHVDPGQELVGDDPAAHHGTKTVGVLGAPKTAGVGTIGICPEARIVLAPSGDDYYSADVHSAVETALLHLVRGDVLVIESQLSITNENYRLGETGSSVRILPGSGPDLVPVEANADVLEAFNRAAMDGVTVVQAAGNGGKELVPIIARTTDEYGGVVDEEMWNPEVDASLAIVVGAGDSETHKSRSTGNFGPRVDCQGWGDSVYAPTSGEDEDKINEDARNWYVSNYSDTSAATAMIGGLVACLQGAHRALHPDFLDPVFIRKLVSCPALGHPDPTGKIGPLPDLHRLLCHEETECVAGEPPLPAGRICPDVFVRDHLGDYGIPLPGFMAGMYPHLPNRSPDILLRSEALADPDAEFGAGAWMIETPSQTASPGPNHFYVRAGNRGEGPDGARIELYLSEPSPFLHPRYWRFIARTELDSVPPLNVAVAPVMRWVAHWVPKGAHYSKIVLLKPHRAGHPVAPDATWSSSEFRDFARLTNDVCFQSLQTATTHPNGTARFRCHLRGVPEGPRHLSFKILSLLPHGTTATVTPHGDLTSTTHPALSLADGVARKLPVHSGSIAYAMPANADVRVDLNVKLTDAPFGHYETTVDQWIGSAHLGRITFVVVVLPVA